MKYSVLAAATIGAAVAQASAVSQELPEPWFKNGQGQAFAECLAGVDSGLELTGTHNMTLHCETTVTGFVSFMQQFSAVDYRGSRVEYSASVKSSDVEGWGGLWMRVDSKTKSGTAFDNMQRRAIKGSADWTRYSVVLDVDQESEVLSIGMLLSTGSGQLWIKDLEVSTVGTDVAVTDMTLSNRELPRQPKNLALTN